MFGRQKQNKQEFTDPLTPETHTSLQDELATVVREIETREENIAHSFQERADGKKHDGEHNRFVDSQLMRVESLKAYRTELEKRIDYVSSGLAHVALDNRID